MNTIAERESLEVSGKAAGAPALEITGLQAWYGESHILHGVDLTVDRGEVVTLLGRNGGAHHDIARDHGTHRPAHGLDPHRRT